MDEEHHSTGVQGWTVKENQISVLDEENKFSVLDEENKFSVFEKDDTFPQNGTPTKRLSNTFMGKCGGWCSLRALAAYHLRGNALGKYARGNMGKYGGGED